MSAAAGLMIAKGVATGISTYQSLSQQEDLLNFNSRQTFMDARIAEQNAEAQAKALRMQGTKLTARQRVSYAKSGLRLEGTPLEVMAETMENIELDAIAKRQAGRFEKAQLETKAKYMKSQAEYIGSTKLFTSVMAGLGGGGAQGAGAMFA